ncbi:MotA/TolQ/ExbB proton channel family protein [Ottowia testudinis]|uniref:Biopolymer transport protein ExbB n=1 Tax=Ottowia testudinis TaxID=2816950 RepID=A0A975H2U0_9BURK|nr:MotA/TolQ/ExbB proton channel family protein [Ottowia testudinis]QTD45124.1 MotA/TolQ/ExbB proton channel family protein [Ottowia testudinis]
MNTPSGLFHVWSQGDWVSRAVLLALIAMSLLSWVVILVKALDLARCHRLARRVDGFWRAPDLPQALAGLLPAPGNPFHQLALAGQSAAEHQRHRRGQLAGALDLSDWLSRALRNSIEASTAQLQGGLALLASVGSTAPFVGLFGTVWGIYHALMRIGAAGQASIDQVAGPIGEALIMTALGLAVAIPAVLGYNALVRGNKQALARLGRFAHDLHAYYLTGERVAAVPALKAA